MKQKQFNVLPIPVEKIREKPRVQVNTESISVPVQKSSIKMLIEISSELSEKLKDQSYAMRIPQPQVVILALEEYCNNHPVEARPEAERNKNKTGRKRKS